MKQGKNKKLLNYHFQKFNYSYDDLKEEIDNELLDNNIRLTLELTTKNTINLYTNNVSEKKKWNKCNFVFNSKYFIHLFSLNYKQIVEDEDDDEEEEDNTIVLELENDDLIKFNNKYFDIKKENVKIAIIINNKDYLKLAKLNRARSISNNLWFWLYYFWKR